MVERITAVVGVTGKEKGGMMWDYFDLDLMLIPVLRWCIKHEIRYIDHGFSFIPQCQKCREDWNIHYFSVKEKGQS